MMVIKMAIYAIGDLHLSFSSNKPMNKFGEHWDMHYEKIKDDWLSCVSDSDTVLISGDISWAMKLEEAKEDMMFISQLPGRKILIKGNHDYWWQSYNKVAAVYHELSFIQNNSYQVGSIAICGTRGWLCPNERNFTKNDKKIYNRECNRLELSLSTVNKACEDIYVMLHYPPTNDRFESSGFTEVLKKYSVSKVLYGHLHGHNAFKAGIKGLVDGIEYHLVSADYLNFKLKKITDCEEQL